MMRGIVLTKADDIDVMVHGLVKYNFFGHEVWLTTTHVSLLIVVLLLTVFSIAAGRAIKKGKEIPDGFQNVAELIVEKLDGMVDLSMGKNARKYYNFIGTIFCFLLASNLSGLLGLRPPTADYGVTFPMGVLVFVLIHFNQIRYQKPKDIWTSMCSPLPPWLPLWLPINIISDIAVPISLSLRLFANILSGTLMMTLVYGMLGWIATIWPAALHVYFDIFSGAIQTYVFCMLTMTYVSDAIGDAEA